MNDSGRFMDIINETKKGCKKETEEDPAIRLERNEKGNESGYHQERS